MPRFRVCLRFVLSIAVFGFLAFTSSHASDKDMQPIDVKGCVHAGVEAGCLILVSADGKSYSLHGKSLPTLDKKLVVEVKGNAGGVDACNQGTVVNVTSWHWTRMRCAKPATASGK